MEFSIDQQHLDHILLDEHDNSLAEELSGLRVEVQRGVKALRSGDYTEFTDETLRDLFDEVESRGREQRATSLRTTLWD